MGNTVNFEDFKREEKKRRRIEWLNDHKKEIVAGISAAGFAITNIVNGINRLQRHREDVARRRDIYDRSTGMYIHCKREMNSREMLEFKERKRNGEDPVRILKDMGLLKR